MHLQLIKKLFSSRYFNKWRVYSRPENPERLYQLQRCPHRTGTLEKKKKKMKSTQVCVPMGDCLHTLAGWQAPASECSKRFQSWFNMPCHTLLELTYVNPQTQGMLDLKARESSMGFLPKARYMCADMVPTILHQVSHPRKSTGSCQL